MGADQPADSATLTHTETLNRALSGQRSPVSCSVCGGPAVQRARKIRLPLSSLSAVVHFGQCEGMRN
jgi:hypothetical protein